MRDNWMAEITNREGLVILFVNYTFFSIIFLMCLLFMLCLAHSSSSPNDVMMSLMLLALSFVMVNIIIADYVVCVIRAQREVMMLL